ncbi:unnamed protein product, partial [marine sediment metagenome]
MIGLSDKAARTRLALHLTKVYIDALDYLVAEGIYMERTAVIRGALRRLFRHHGIESFSKESEADAPSEQLILIGTGSRGSGEDT